MIDDDEVRHAQKVQYYLCHSAAAHWDTAYRIAGATATSIDRLGGDVRAI